MSVQTLTINPTGKIVNTASTIIFPANTTLVASGSLIGTSSYSNTASYAINSRNAGTTLTTASTYPITSSWAITASISTTSATATSASYASTSSVAVTALSVTSASYALTSSFTTASNVIGTVSSASFSTLSATASYFSGSNVISTFITTSNLLVTGSSQAPINVVVNIPNYAQISIQNVTSSNSASTDFIVLNDKGTISSSGYFVDVGINSSQFVGTIGGPNEGYAYYTASSGNNFYIGNSTPNGNLYLFVGGTTNTSSVAITSNGISCSSITASLFGTASVAKSASIATSASYASTSSVAVSVTSASYAKSASYAPNGLQLGGTNYDVQLNISGTLVSAASLAGGSQYGALMIEPLDTSLTSSYRINILKQVDTGMKTFHATLYYSGSIYMVGQKTDGSNAYALLQIRNVDTGDFTNSTANWTKQQTGYSNGMSMCTDGTWLYVVFADGSTIRQFSLADITNYNYYASSINFGAQASICTDGTYLYIVSANSPADFLKYQISTMTLVASASWAGVNVGHMAIIDPSNPTYFYASNVDPLHGTAAKVKCSNLTYTSSFVGGYFTDDALIQNGNLYLGNESLGIITVFNTSSFTFTTQSADVSYGIWGDGTNIYNGSPNGYFVVYQNGNLNVPLRYYFDFYCAPNELMLTNNGKMFITNWYNNDQNLYQIAPYYNRMGVNNNNPRYALDVYGDVGCSYLNVASTLSASSVVAATLFQLPYSSSTKALTPVANVGSAYMQMNASTNILYIYNGTNWTSASLA